MKWYTDGSKTAQGTETGICELITIHFGSLGLYLSIFQTKINAIETSVQFNIDRSCQDGLGVGELTK